MDEVGESLSEGGVLQVAVAVLVVLEVVEEKHGRLDGPQRLPEIGLKLPVSFFGRQAVRPGDPDLPGDLFEERGGNQLAAGEEDEEAAPSSAGARRRRETSVDLPMPPSPWMASTFSR